MSVSKIGLQSQVGFLHIMLRCDGGPILSDGLESRLPRITPTLDCLQHLFARKEPLERNKSFKDRTLRDASMHLLNLEMYFV